MTKKGKIATKQMILNRDKIKTIGFSILRQPGPFSLEIQRIEAVNSRYSLGDFDVLDSGYSLDKSGHVRKSKTEEIDGYNVKGKSMFKEIDGYEKNNDVI